MWSKTLHVLRRYTYSFNIPHTKIEAVRKLLRWIKFKGWFIFDLPYFIKENRFRNGLELGAKAGRSMYFALNANAQLYLTGIDLWEIIQGGAYRHNDKNESRCRKRLRKFGSRVKLIKGDASVIAGDIPDESFDFIFYDLQCKDMSSFHQEMIALWTPKIRKGGVLIGRDFRDFREAFYAIGYQESDFRQCRMGPRVSTRLEYLQIK